MRHRGPDEEGFLFGEPRAPGLALGMRRLSIIDLAGGHQPIWNETKDVAVVFNGELYGYRELRDRQIGVLSGRINGQAGRLSGPLERPPMRNRRGRCLTTATT